MEWLEYRDVENVHKVLVKCRPLGLTRYILRSMDISQCELRYCCTVLVYVRWRSRS